MPAIEQDERVLVATIAAETRWATCPDRTAATAPARLGLRMRFAREVDPRGTMQPDERARRVDALHRAHMAKMTLRASQARRLKAGA